MIELPGLDDRCPGKKKACLLMFDPFMPLQLAQAASRLMLHNTASSMALWTDATRQSTAYWANVANTAANDLTPAALRRKTTRSWYRHPDAIASPFPFVATAWSPFQPFAEPMAAMMRAAPAMPFMSAFMGPATGIFAPQVAAPFDLMAPWQAWLRLFPRPSGIPAWPMAAVLMAAGMPQRAAWPTAEASAHVIAAAQQTAKGVEEMFASYRSEGGHAQVLIGRSGRVH